MLRFFRQLRQRLLTENRFSKYLLYAVGEILLVVIGILIALQIDTWNETRKDRLAERGIIQNLRQEFSANRQTLDSTIAIMEKTKDANLRLMALFGESEGVLKEINLDSIIFYSVEFHRFVPAQNALQDLLQSGRLQLLTNEALKNLLFDWARVMGLVDESYSMVKQKTEDDIVPYLTPRYPLKNIDAYGDLNWKEPSRVAPARNLAIFEDLSYENLVDDQLYRLFRYDKDMKAARAIIEEILRLLETP